MTDECFSEEEFSEDELLLVEDISGKKSKRIESFNKAKTQGKEGAISWIRTNFYEDEKTKEAIEYLSRGVVVLNDMICYEGKRSLEFCFVTYHKPTTSEVWRILYMNF